MNDMKRGELLTRISRLGTITKDQRKSVVCSLIGHSKIQKSCFGYFYCGRCGDQVGDTLAGCYDTKGVVIVGHNCKTCRKNYKLLTWKDRLYAPDPFKKQAA